MSGQLHLLCEVQMNARRLFFRTKSPVGPKNHRAYAIGDVHGRLDLLDRLLKRVESDIAERPAGKVSIIFLGDLIDRGSHSAQVVERLRTYECAGAGTHFIMGNHEEVMLRVLEGEPGVLSSWLRFGGAETLQSYGVDPGELECLQETEATSRVKNAVPDEHRVFLEGFADSISFGSYLFVHAGIRPGIELSEQSHFDLRWIRDPFLDDESDHGFIIVHGHTISDTVETTSNRVGIDTGAYRTDVLTALAIEGPERWLLQTSRNGIDRFRLD